MVSKQGELASDERRRVVVLGVDGRSTRILCHYLLSRFEVAGVILEPPVSKRRLLKRRVQKLGLRRVVGQVAFSAMVAAPLRRASEGRIREIIAAKGLSDAPIPPALVTNVESVNAEACRTKLKALDPTVVVINGTRIIGKKTLSSVSARFLNIHAGITPRYRGVHGAYWALAENDEAHAGVTVYFVDEGIDTGDVIAQATIDITPEDNFATYPFLQLVAGLPLLEQALQSVLRGEDPRRAPMVSDSRLWSHPTIGGYLLGRIARGVR